MSGLPGHMRALRAAHGRTFRILSGLVGIASYVFSSVQVARWHDVLRKGGADLPKDEGELLGLLVVVTVAFVLGGGLAFKYPNYSLPFFVVAMSLCFGIGFAGTEFARKNSYVDLKLWGVLATCALVLAVLGIRTTPSVPRASGAAPRPRWGLIAMCSLICLGAGAMGLQTAWERRHGNRQYRAGAVAAEGVVVAYRPMTPRSTYMIPVFRYVTTGGRTIENTAWTGAGHPDVGTRVSLLVSPTDPRHFATADAVSDEFDFGSLVVAGLFFLAGLFMPVRALLRTRRGTRETVQVGEHSVG